MISLAKVRCDYAIETFQKTNAFQSQTKLWKALCLQGEKNLKKNMRLNTLAFNRTFQSQELTGVAFRSLLFLCQTPILILKIDSTDNRYQDNGSCNNNCIHLLFFFNSSFLPSFTQYIPYPRTIIVRSTTTYRIIGSFISANTVDSNNAVTIYLAMSISHFPNSVFIGKSR